MNQELAIVLVGVGVSLATSFLKKENWSSQVKQTLGVALAFVGGVIAVYLDSNGVDATKVLTSWAATLGVSQAVFSYVLKTTGLENILSGIGSPNKPGDH